MWGGSQKQMFQQYQQLMQMNLMMGGGMPPGMQKAVKGGGDMQWKEHLHNTMMKKSGGTVDEKPTYETEENENRKYKGTVTVEGQSYVSGWWAPSKKAAEHDAAQAAMKAKFPAEFKKFSQEIRFESMMQWMGQGQKGKGGGGNSETRWKEHLHNTMMQKSGGTVENKPTYETEENENRKYKGTVTVDGQSYVSAWWAPSKKEAEHGAAKAAMKALYPPEYKKFSKDAGFASMMQGWMGQGATGQEQKQSSKNKLLDSVQLIITKNHQRNMSKDDIEWVVQELEGEKKKTYQCTVTITASIGVEGGRAFNGEVCNSKKEAEASAAQIAYDSMKDIFSPLEQQHQEKKKEKMEEDKKRREEKRAEKRAATT